MGDFIDEIMGLTKDFQGVAGDLKNVGKDLSDSLLGTNSAVAANTAATATAKATTTATATAAPAAVCATTGATASAAVAANEQSSSQAPRRRGVIVTQEPEDIDPALWEAEQQAAQASQAAAQSKQEQEKTHEEERQQFISSMVDKATSAAMYSKTTRPVAIAAKNIQHASDKLSAVIGVDDLYETGKQAVIKNSKDWVDFAKEKLDL